ncbi:hypothetical protein F2Q68_00039339 [Brassica cretica]|uniref:Uncharacterized protein n=1 Tax=Brassica cretica TaxID=69181 RepID=A0A8S9M8Y3_BRACR|nr:hypothetical protein F2Q68_00039339 [Brassica cretica]
MRDTTKNTVPNGSNNKRKRETIIDDAENINSQSISNQIPTSVPLKRVFGSVLSDVTNLHPSVGRLTNQTGQLSSLNASAVSGTTMETLTSMENMSMIAIVRKVSQSPIQPYLQ